MSIRTDELDDRQWVAIDVAAEALQVSTTTAYRLALQHRWRHDQQHPRAYLLADIRNTHDIRQQPKPRLRFTNRPPRPEPTTPDQTRPPALAEAVTTRDTPNEAIPGDA